MKRTILFLSALCAVIGFSSVTLANVPQSTKAILIDDQSSNSDSSSSDQNSQPGANSDQQNQSPDSNANGNDDQQSTPDSDGDE